MRDKNEIRIKFEIGEIKFEAEGSADLVERERSIFNDNLLPAAIEAIVRTRGMVQGSTYLDASELKQSRPSASSALLPENTDLASEPDLSRSTLASFIRGYGPLSEQDFVLFSAHFDEVKNKTHFFTKDDAEKFYDEARRTKPKNISACLNQLAQKGFIIDAADAEQKTPKPYRVSNGGLEYIKNYVPKEITEKKPVKKLHKQRSKGKTLYADINCDELNLASYPSVTALKDFKEKMMLVLYIVTNEEKGEWFTTEDVLFLLTDIFGEAATKGQVNGVFRRQKMWFKIDRVNGKSVKRKLLNQGIEFAKSITVE